MANKKIKKSTQRKVKKVAKKHPILVVIAILLIVAIVACVVLHKKGVIHVPFLDGIFKEQAEEVEGVGGAFTSEDIQTISGSDLSIHFLMLGNKYTGDSVLIKTGNTEILIDAGSRKNSAKTITDYVDDFCTDGVLEYVIATHADQDHIAAFPDIFEKYECKTIVDFPKTGKNTATYNNYVTAREAEVALGAVHYTALECWNNENGAQRTYTLGNGITMQFLYQKFYEESTTDENDYSVCMLLNDSENYYLFTGDLEEDGEKSLVQENNLPKCKLFKAGHHGSKTSSTSELLSVIQPEIVCVCCCCGSDEYTDNVANMFPTQAFVDRVAPYTPNVYVTTIVSDDESGYTAMNGNIVVMKNGSTVSVRCSNNAIPFKDTEWFKNNRTLPSAWAS